MTEPQQPAEAIASRAPQDPRAPVPRKRPEVKKDKWAHRRAEPRTLAFLWAVYILTAGVLTIGVLLFRGPWALLDETVYQYAARTMLLCVAIGLAILWPMTRLSQSVTLRDRPGPTIFKDMLVLLPPTQAVVWAQAAARAGWAVDLIGAMALSLWAWPMLLGAVLAIVLRPRVHAHPAAVYDAGTVFVGSRGPSVPTRTLTMLFIVLAALLPLLALRFGPGWATMLSPVSAVLDLGRQRGVGPDDPSVVGGRWVVLFTQLGLALVAWVLLALIEPHRPRPVLPPQLDGPETGPERAASISSEASPRGLGSQPDARGDRLSGATIAPDALRTTDARTQEGQPMDYMTAEEQVKIKARLDDLIANRPKITERIAEARALGDLKENAEYHSARELQGMEEAEIRRLEDRLANAKIVDDGLAKDAQVVFLGSMVKIREVGGNEDEMVKLVGEFSDDPPDDYDEVTANSPMGSALMKARVGETVRVDAPRGVKRFEIVEIM